MDGMSPARPKHAIPRGLLGFIVLVIAVESGLDRGGRYANDQADHWGIKKKVARGEAVTCDILSFGDSLVEFAVLPKVIEERSRRSTYNLAIPAGTPAATYQLLKAAIDAGARPRAVVVDFLPFQLVRMPFFENTRRRMWPEGANLAELFEFAWSRRDPDFAASMGLARLFKSIRSRDEIRRTILEAFDNRHFSLGDYNAYITRWNLRSNRGSLVMPAGTRVADKVVQTVGVNPSAFDPVYVDYADRFLRLAAAHKIPVYCLLTPISPEHQAAYDKAGVFHNHNAFLRAKQAQFPNLIVVDGRHSGYDPSLFVDGIHLNRRGATALTTDLSALIERGPDPARWAELPRFRDRPTADSVEDIRQSQIAIETPKARRR